MAAVNQKFEEYTYQVLYKVTPDSPEVPLSIESRVLPGSATEVVNGVVVTIPHPDYDLFMNPVVVSLLPQDSITLILVRNPVYSVDSVTGERVLIKDTEEVGRRSYNILSYDYRSSFIFSDKEVDTQRTYRVLFQLLNINPVEKIPCKYSIEGLKFLTDVSEAQTVDLNYKKVTDTDWINIGYDLKTGTKGEFPSIELNNLLEDTEYLLQVYHQETNKEYTFSFTTNLVPSIGLNPIIGKTEWNGRQLFLDAPNVKSRMHPSNQLVDWMFPMDYSTKSFDNILSSLWSSVTDKYNFVVKSTRNNTAEVYIGCKIDSSYYLSLPFDYVNEKLPNNGEDFNIYFDTLFENDTDTTIRKTLFCKFLIEENHVGPVKLFNFINSSGLETFIGINYNNNLATFSAFGTEFNFTNPLQREKWYTLVLVIKGRQILFASITDNTNFQLSSLPNNVGATVGEMESTVGLVPSDRADVVIEITYDAVTSDNENMGLYLNYANYKFQENTPENTIINSGSSPAFVITNGLNQTQTFTAINEGGYGFKAGYSLKFLNGGVTSNGSVTIKDLKVNGNSIFSTIGGKPFVIDNEAIPYMNGSRTQINFLKTGDTISDPVGGELFTNITAPLNISTKSHVLLGGRNQPSSNFIIAKVGFRKSFVTASDSWSTPYNYLDQSVFRMLGEGYKLMPYLKCTNQDSGEVTIIPTSEMSELKDATIKFYLSNLPKGKTTFEVMSGADSLNSVVRTIKNIKMSPEDAEYDINFEDDFNLAVAQLKSRYYAKQKRWGGNMGGGTNGNLIYFNRGEKCLILEQHGDLYDGVVPSVAPAGKEGYGLPVSIVENPLNYFKPTSQRTGRVGGLIQSVDYHGYGMFDCWFNVPKGMAGLAICLWYFHYQEIYDYDKEFKFWTETGWNGFKYKDSVESGFGATWVVINNEIDMELGSENTPYRTSVNPNQDASISWYVHGLDKRQMIGCTNESPELYGTWIIDWEASLPRINSVTSTDPQNAFAYLKTNDLVWVKVNSKLDEVNYGANNRSCRFNNWVNERWNDGTGVYGLPSNSPLGKGEMSVNNRVPLGEIYPKALEEHLRYIEKYYDDGMYHKWSIDWNKDRTRLLIDDVEIAVLKAFVPFNPMTMLIGCWFPSGNVYDKNVLLGDFGTWAGVNANWETAQMKVKRIKFRPYTESEASTEQMRYDCETYAEDGLREIL